MAIANTIKKFTVQDAIYWGNPTPDGYGGFTYDDPVQIKVRWDQKQEIVTNDKGTEVISDAQVLVNFDMKPGEYLMLGTIEDLGVSGYEDPEEVSGAERIVGLEKIPMPRSNTDFARTVKLAKK